jgi:type II secretory pathway pseudopilin PulG
MNVGCIIGLVLGIGIFIIGILAALAVPAATSVMKRAKQVRTHAAMKDLCFGLISYHTEYARFPATDSEVMVTAEGALLKALMGQGEHNPRQVVFLDVPLAVGGKNGLLVKGDDETLVDIWGQTYRILMDVDGNGSIASPEPQQKPLTESVLVWSAGEDGDFDTWEDNLASWKPYRSTPD